MSPQRARYLIIGGTTKAATTSLYFYLKDHPQVCPSNLKESRFFLDRDYPLSSEYRFDEGLERYECFFEHCCDNRVRMEATPDCLYSPGTAKKLRDSLPFAKLLFILREPVSRLISWYRFAKQIGRLPTNMSFDEYVLMQIEGRTFKIPGQHAFALRQGKYPYLSFSERIS